MKNSLLILSFCIIALGVNGQTSDAINNAYFGVPSSPAFELLPDKPSEVTHIMTPKDFTSFVPTVFDGKKLKTGVSFDWRPFSWAVGSITNYQKSKFKQILWRTVLSAGTAGKQESNDAFVSGGIRIPIIDRGDARADHVYIDSLEYYVTSTTEQPHFESVAKVNDDVAKKLKGAKDRYIASHWNAFRLDIGLSNMWSLKSASVERDSIGQNRGGLWIASSIPLGKRMQCMVSAKNAWVKTDADTLETSRASLGTRLRFFATSFAISVEYARIWSNYGHQESLNESWNHFGALLEIPVTKLKGVIGLTYGGDTSRRDAPHAKFEFKYAVYTDQILKRRS